MSDTYLPNDDIEDDDLEPGFLDDALPHDQTGGEGTVDDLDHDNGALLGNGASNTRFIFFIFMLLPVRTLFAHQWLTMPQYIMRAYNKDVADHMEWLVN